MQGLSNRAARFLQQQKRIPGTTDRNDILASFRANNAPVYEPLIEFQQEYSGYIFNAGLAPIQFGLLRGDGGYPVRTNTAIIEFYESFDETCAYHYVCASTDYQMEFTLDENGCYYEDHLPVAASFGKTIEHLAIWDEIRSKTDFKVVVRDKKMVMPEIDKKPELELISEASDQFTLWFKNDSIYMKQWQGLTTLFVSKIVN